MKAVSLALAVLAVSFHAGPAQAQERQLVVDLRYQVEAARKLMEKERRVVIAGEMNLTDSERQPFWGVYAEYEAAMAKVDKARASQLAEYAEIYRDLSEADAKRLLTDYFAQERETLKIREKFRKRFERVLPLFKVARFYQVENKLNAIYDFQLASRIPLIQDPPVN